MLGGVAVAQRGAVVAACPLGAPELRCARADGKVAGGARACPHQEFGLAACYMFGWRKLISPRQPSITQGTCWSSSTVTFVGDMPGVIHVCG